VNDPRIDLIVQELKLHAGRTPADTVTAAADTLADIGTLTAGEARLILGAVVSAMALEVDPSHFDASCEWCAQLSKGRQHIVSSGDDLQDHIADQAAGRYAMVDWPWPCLTRESRSLMPGSVTIVCGTPGASKSWFALSCLRYWLAHGVSSAVLMLEETKKWHLQRGLAQCSGDPHLLYPEWIQAHRERAEAIWETHRNELAILAAHLTCEGDTTLAACAEWVEAQCDAGKRVVIVDPVTLADSGSDKPWEADRKFMARCKVAIEKSGTSLILITHPKKGGNGKGGPPSLDDLAGGAAYGRACASALWVAGADGDMVPIITNEGDYREGNPRKIIRILKARNSTGCGKVLGYTFDELHFDELGEIAGKRTEAAPSARGEKLRAQPSNDENHFNV